MKLDKSHARKNSER